MPSSVGLPQDWLQEAAGIFSLLFRVPTTVPETAGVLGAYWFPWAQGPSLSLVAIMIYSWWVFIGYYALIYLNGLSAIPRQLYEAAEVDGAGKAPELLRNHPPAAVSDRPISCRFSG